MLEWSMGKLGAVLDEAEGQGLVVGRGCFWGQKSGWWFLQWILRKRDDELV